MTEINDNDGYKSDFTANTQNVGGTFQFNANSTMFDATANDKSNREVLEGSQYNLNVNAVAVRKRKHSILRGQQKEQFKSTKMPTGAIAKITTPSMIV